jgi:norsolorinic acid ketoreductase
VKIDNKSETDPANAVASIKDQGVTSLDLVIANAGICNDFASVATCDPAIVKEHVTVNGLGPLFLFQATLPLLQKSEGAKFVGIGSPMGSIGGMDMCPYPMTAYGTSKAIFHWIVRKIHFEHPELVSLVIDPG